MSSTRTRQPSRRRAIAVLSCLAGFAAAAAYAAPAGPDEPQVPGDLMVSDWKLGPFFVQPTFAVRDVGYDSNVFLTRDELAESDFTATVAPGMILALPFGDNLFRLRQEFSYQFFQEFESQSGWNQETAPRLDLLAGPLSIEIEDTFRWTKQLYSVELHARPRRFDNLLRGLVRTPRDAGAYLEGTGSHFRVRVDRGELFLGAPLADVLDRNELGAGGGVFLDFLEGTRLAAGGDLRSIDYLADDPADRDADGYFAWGGLRFEPGNTMTGDLRVGLRRDEVGGQAHPRFRGVGFLADVAFDSGGQARLDIDVSRRNAISDLSSNELAVATQVRARLRLPLAERLAIDLLPYWEEYEYPVSDEEEAGADFSGRHEVLSLGAELSIYLVEDFSVQFGGLYRQLESTGFQAYDLFTLTTGFRYGT